MHASCYDVEKLLNKPVNHCWSCHDEVESGAVNTMCEDYGIDHGLSEDLYLEHCCTCLKLTGEEFKLLFELKEKENDLEEKTKGQCKEKEESKVDNLS